MNFKENLRCILPSAVRPRRILAGPLRGNFIVTSWHNYPAALLGYAESDLMAWFAKAVRPGETWLDLGAHYGYTSLGLCHYVGQQGRVFAFEPLLSTAGHLTSTRSVNKLSHLTIVPLALGDDDEITRVDVNINKAMAQPLSVPVDRSWVEAIYCVALDRLWPRLCGASDTISGIKMDVEGMEAKALQGMVGVLRKHKPKLVIEVHKSRGVDLEVLALVLSKAGYCPSGRRLIEKPLSADASYEFTAGDDQASYTLLERPTSPVAFAGTD